ncbi:radical SAM protein [Azospirillum sp.]|uniref:radical SAM protein n=1 Tax=Azospirillum sp. TaxID=34012 RepID=UPI003D745E30
MRVSSRYVYVDAACRAKIERLSEQSNEGWFDLVPLEDPISFIREQLAAIERVEPGDDLYPYIVFGDVTNNCNLRCRHCINPDWSIATSKRMTLRELDKYVSLLPLFGNNSFGLSCRMEPLLHPEFIDLVESLPEHVRRRASFTSNFAVRKLKDEFFERIVAAGIDHIRISIDSLSKLHFEEIRVNAKFDFFEHNIRALSAKIKEAGRNNVLLTTVVLRQNLREIPALIHDAQEMFPGTSHEVRRPYEPINYIADEEWKEKSIIGEDEWAWLVKSIQKMNIPYARASVTNGNIVLSS